MKNSKISSKSFAKPSHQQIGMSCVVFVEAIFVEKSKSQCSFQYQHTEAVYSLTFFRPIFELAK